MSNETQGMLGSRAAARRKPQKPPKAKKKARWGMRIVSLFFLLLLGAGCYVGYLYFKADQAINLITDDDAIEVPKEESVTVKPVTFLLLGLDGRANGGGMNTDVIKVISMNPDDKSSTIVSVARDTRIELDGYRANKANAYYAAFYSQSRNAGKSADEAHAVARDEMKLLFSRYFDIPVDYTVVVNFAGFSDVVDAVGGITVDVDMNMCYFDSVDGTNIQLKAGEQKLEGKEALDYVRYRQSHPKCSPRTKESNDMERNARQTQVIGAIVDRMASLGGVTRLDRVIEAAGTNMRTNMHSSEFKNFLTTYYSINSSKIESVPLDGVWRSPYVHVNEEQLGKARAALQNRISALPEASDLEA